MITNNGTIRSLGPIGGYAILASPQISGDPTWTATTTINNSGTITGEIDLGDNSASVVNNLRGGVIAAPTTLNVGGGTVYNSGTFDVGEGTLLGKALAINGNFDNFDQSGNTGELNFDLFSSTKPTTYQLSVTGATSLAGDLGIDTYNFNLAAGDEFDLIQSAGGLSGDFSGLSFDNVACTGDGTDVWRCGGFDFDLSIGNGALDLSVGDALGSPSPVPETSTWAMMLIGFASLGFAAFRGKRKRNRLDDALA